MSGHGWSNQSARPGLAMAIQVRIGKHCIYYWTILLSEKEGELVKQHSTEDNQISCP